MSTIVPFQSEPLNLSKLELSPDYDILAELLADKRSLSTRRAYQLVAGILKSDPQY